MKRPKVPSSIEFPEKSIALQHFFVCLYFALWSSQDIDKILDAKSKDKPRDGQLIKIALLLK